MDEPDVPAAVTPPPTIIRVTCVVLIAIGLGSVLLSAPAIVGPASTRCHLARTWLDEANTDRKDWNNVDTGGTKVDDLSCDDAIRLAGQIKLKEKGTATASVPSETGLRIQATLAVVMGLGQAISGGLVLRRLSRPARNAAIAFSAVGIVLRILGIVSLGVFGLVVYAFAFSPASKTLWAKDSA